MTSQLMDPMILADLLRFSMTW